MLRFLSLWVLVGCAGSSHPSSARAPAVDPTLGLCAAERTVGATTATELLRAADDALQRRCPREAALDALAARAAPDLGNREPAVVWLLDEAGQASLALTFVGEGVLGVLASDLPDEQWAKLYRADVAEWAAKGVDVAEWEPLLGVELSQPHLAVIDQGIRIGAVPRVARDDGRLGRLAVRYTRSVPCERKNIATNETDASTFRETLKTHHDGFVPVDPIAYLELEAYEKAWTCRLADAARDYDEIARKRDAAGQDVRAADARLTAWELRYLPGGSASALGMSDDHAMDARDIELALHGVGLTYQAGAAASAALDAIVERGGLDLVTEARVSWLRAELALRMLGKPVEAARNAARVRELAVQVRRADLLDSGRLIGALAAVELRNTAEAQWLLTDLFASVKRRGALGVRDMAVNVLVSTLAELAARGRNEDALAIARAARAAAPSLTVMQTIRLHGEVADAFVRLGRLDDALEALDALQAEVNANPDRSPLRAQALLMLDLQIATARFQLDGSVQPSDLLHIPPNDYLPMLQAGLDGDLGPLRAFLQRTDHDAMEYLVTAPFSCAARPRELAAGAREAIRIDAVGRRQVRTRDPTAIVQASARDGLRLILGIHLMKCGASIREPELVELGRQMADSEPELVELGRQMADSEDLARFNDALVAMAHGRADDAATILSALDREALDRPSSLRQLKMSAQSTGWLDLAAGAFLSSQPPRVADALALFERSRARDLRVLRTTRRASESDPALHELIEAERGLATANQRLRALTAMASTQGWDARFADLLKRAEHDVAAQTKQREDIARALSTTDPVAYRAAALAAPRAPAEIQALLGDDEALIYYSVDLLRTWAVVVDRHAIRVVELPALDGDRLPRLAVRIRAYDNARRAVTAGARGGPSEIIDAPTPDPAELIALRAELYELLVRPLESVVPEGKRILIVPDAATAGIAFAELGPADHPWIARNSLRILPGAYMLDARTPATGGDALVIGDPDFGGGADCAAKRSAAVWKRLCGTRDEAIAIGHMLHATPVLGAAATEQLAKQRMPSASIIHFATHGQADLQRPSASVVVLSLPRNSGGGEDGLLHAYEIERMRLRARLVVLSACETGKGQMRGNEGSLALDRAFLVAGAGAVVSSLWAVDDGATQALMTRFYAELAQGRSADQALAQAMLFVRSTPKWADPKYWAAFRLVGAGSR